MEAMRRSNSCGVRILTKGSWDNQMKLRRVLIQDELNIETREDLVYIFISCDQKTLAGLMNTIGNKGIDFSGKYVLCEFSGVLMENFALGIESGKLVIFSKKGNFKKHKTPYNPDNLCRELLTKIFQSLIKDDISTGYNYLFSLLKTLAQHLVEIYKSKDHQLLNKIGLTSWQIQKMNQYIEKHISDTITLQHLAEELGLSPGYLCKKCKQTTGYTPVQYLTKVRMERALDLLLNSDLLIIQVGLEVGIDNHAQFCRTFRKFYGTTPSHCRKSELYAS